MRDLVAAELKLSDLGLGSWAHISSADPGARDLENGSPGAKGAVRVTRGQTTSTSRPRHIAQGHLCIFRAFYSFLMTLKIYEHIPAGKKGQTIQLKYKLI